MLLRAIPPLWLAIALCGAVAAICWHGWRVDHQRLVACQTARAADRKAYTSAQAAATKRAIDEKRTTEARQEQARKDSDNALAVARADARRRLADWMRTNAAHQGYSGRTDLPRTAETAASDNRRDPAAFVVGSDDLAICTDNSVRLKAARDWALRKE
jgi:hypothetical protein